jgi:hypothetical protein
MKFNECNPSPAYQGTFVPVELSDGTKIQIAEFDSRRLLEIESELKMWIPVDKNYMHLTGEDYVWLRSLGISPDE